MLFAKVISSEPSDCNVFFESDSTLIIPQVGTFTEYSFSLVNHAIITDTHNVRVIQTAKSAYVFNLVDEYEPWYITITASNKIAIVSDNTYNETI